MEPQAPSISRYTQAQDTCQPGTHQNPGAGRITATGQGPSLLLTGQVRPEKWTGEGTRFPSGFGLPGADPLRLLYPPRPPKLQISVALPAVLP
jgi:hypothetical protein